MWILAQVLLPDNASNRYGKVSISAAAIADVVSQLQILPLEFAAAGCWQNMIYGGSHWQRPTLGHIHGQSAKMTDEAVPFGDQDRERVGFVIEFHP